MNQTAINRMLVDNLADRYLSKLQFDPHRSIRKLVDLGECLSNGKTQKQFFQAVQKLLEKDSNPYYTLVQRVVSQVDYRSIKTIGMNLGLNSWTALASRKSREAAPPWTMLFRLSDAPDALSVDELTGLLRQSANLGIHTFLLMLDRSYDAIDELIGRISSFPDCAFGLFTTAGQLTSGVLDRARGARNMLISLEDAPDRDPEPAARTLRDLKYPFALHKIYSTASEAENILCGSWLERVNRLLSPFAFFLPGADCPAESQAAVREYARRLRTAPKQPVFSMSLIDDVADVDRMISGKPRLLRVDADGTLDAAACPAALPDTDAGRIALAELLNQYACAAPAM